ncbi:MAG TPA: CHAT domain-containing protein [Thermoanaerobaculia bacterium]|nr:CHAT domain-containing protein [Thermoanaerobaculia bacterium]
MILSARLPAGAVLAAALLTLPAESLRPGESRVHEIALEAGHAWRIAVEQIGIDVTVEVTGPDGQRIVAADSPFDRQGTETVLVTGGSKLVVRAREAGAPPGRYTVRIDSIDDPGRIEAEAAMGRAGEAYLEGSPEGRKRSLAEYLRASELYEGEEKARALYAAAVLARLTGDNRQALELGEKVLPLWQSLDDRLWEASARNEIGLSLWLLGRMDEARTSFEAALAIQREIGDRYGEAVSLSNLCASDLPQGRLREALACYGEALPKLREVKAAALEGAALTSAGRALDVLGQPEQALLRYREALALTRSVGDRVGEAQALNNLAVLHRQMGEYQEALASYGQALEIFSFLQNRRWQARVLQNLGAIYQGLGEPRQALPQYEQALPLWREAGDREGEAITLTNLGRVHGSLGDPRRALELYEQALVLERAAGDRRGEGITLAHTGLASLALDDPAGALAAFDGALGRLRAVGDALYEADALHGRGRAQAALGKPEEALASLEQALTLARNARIPASEARALCSLARIEHGLGRTDAARAHAAAAIEVIESLRTKIGNPDLRSSFAATLHEAYELQIDLLMEAHRASPGAGFDRMALETGERARARTFLELLGEAGIDLRQGVEPALLERRTTLERRLSARSERLLREKDPAVRATLLGEQGTLLRELDLVDAQIRESSPAHAALIRPQPLGAAGIQSLLDPDTLLLSYSLGEARSYLFAVTSTSVESFELPSRSRIEEAARKVHGGLSVYDAENRASEAREAAGLSRMVLGPAAHLLEKRRLVIVADDALHYVAFGALPQDAAEDAAPVPLLESREIVYLPSASTLAVQRKILAARPSAARWVAVVADPAFDPRDPAFVRLPASRQEAEAIAALAPPGQARLALGSQASRQEVLGDRLSGYRAVHFATHGVVDAEHPSLSGLALSEGFLPLRDVYGLRLGADLVVLSGCRTALGREIRGEGIAGLARGFFHAGAPRVVASLWQVEDRATAELMIRFYRAMWTEGLAPAAALRSAQLSIRGERRWRDPYFWAGFVLQGDWR